jgi:hypothetical protein
MVDVKKIRHNVLERWRFRRINYRNASIEMKAKIDEEVEDEIAKAKAHEEAERRRGVLKQVNEEKLKQHYDIDTETYTPTEREISNTIKEQEQFFIQLSSQQSSTSEILPSQGLPDPWKPHEEQYLYPHSTFCVHCASYPCTCRGFTDE